MFLLLSFLRLLPMWSYLCPKCQREVEKNSHKCVHCRERYGVPLRVPPKVLKDKKALEDYVHREIFPRISIEQRDYLTRFFTVLFSSGWENSGGTDVLDGGAWTAKEGGTDPTVASNIKHHGIYSMRSNPLVFDQEDVYKTGLTATAIMYERFYTYIDTTLPPTDGDSFDFGGVGRTDWTNAVFCVLMRGAILSGQNYWGISTYIGGVQTLDYEATPSNPSLDIWYCFELVRDVTNGRSKLYVDGVLKVDVARAHSGNSDMVWAGVGYAGYSNLDTYYDCVVVADAYIGPEVARVPTILELIPHPEARRKAIFHPRLKLG